MFENFIFFFYQERRIIKNINFQILCQSRKSEIFINFNIKDNFQNRLNLQILHLSLILINLNKHTQNITFYKNKIFKLFFNNFDLEFREKGMGDKLIEKKIFEIVNLVNYHLIEYKENLNQEKSLILILKKFFIFNDLDNNVKYLERYINKQNNHLKNVDFTKNFNQKIFLDCY